LRRQADELKKRRRAMLRAKLDNLCEERNFCKKKLREENNND
jgi:mRNA-degrading endonuclease RelE of RelBE toxin-antitoxin system